MQDPCHAVERYSVSVEGKRKLRLTYFLRELLQYGVLKLSLDEGSICLNYNSMRTTIIDNCLLLTEGVELSRYKTYKLHYYAHTPILILYLYLIHRR